MGLTETEGIVLRSYNLAEADKIVVCLTRHAGIVRTVARGARRLKSRFGAGLEPFTIIDLTYYEKEGRELVSLRQAEIIRSFFSLAQSAEVVAALAYMSELVMEFAPPHEPNEKLFRMVKAVVEALSSNQEDLPALLRYFEVWMLKLAGFLPDLRTCADCGRKLGEDSPAAFLNAEFRARCSQCSHRLGREFSREAHGQLRSAQKLAPTEFAAYARETGAGAMTELAELSQDLIGRVLERQPRSQAVLT
ncbi:MAG TPA: DNA repair protein RecO [Pyrinomonadaceae bacterium]|nr:DNA repair protein RecO [Pyrinomonadaceae bacterium]